MKYSGKSFVGLSSTVKRNGYIYAAKDDYLTKLLDLGGSSDHGREEAIKVEDTQDKEKLQQIYNLVCSSPGLKLECQKPR